MHYSVIVQVRQMYSQYVRPVALHLRNVLATVNVNHLTKYTKKTTTTYAELHVNLGNSNHVSLCALHQPYYSKITISRGW